MQVRVTNNYNDSNMTSLQGYVTTHYADLVKLFGEPLRGGDKTTAEWILKFEDGTVATIYDWKEYTTPMGWYDWHVGGNKRTVVALVQEVLDGKIEVVDAFWTMKNDDKEIAYYGA